MSITLNGHQLKSLLEFVNPDGEKTIQFSVDQFMATFDKFSKRPS